ncbi:MAG: TIGR02147 family protein [Bacteriovoracia bacterium]
MATRPGTLPKPNLFEYTDYRKYLEDYYNFKKATDPGFSYRSFAKAAGFTSSNFFVFIITGQRNLTPSSTEKTIQAVKLQAREATFFRALVKFNQAKTVAERERAAKDLVSDPYYKKVHPLREAEFNCFADWFTIPIREMVGKTGAVENVAELASLLIPVIPVQQAKKAIEELKALGMIERAAGGELEQTSQVVTTPDEVTSVAVSRFHKQMIQKAIEAIDRLPKSERDVSGLTLAISEECYQEVKEILRRCREEIVKQVVNDTRAAERVYQVNFQIYPLTLKFNKQPKP